MNKSRLEAFSDGVLAIIITIMVLEIKVPETANWQGVTHLIPTLVSYILSFAVVGVYWNNHHHLLHALKKVSSAMMWTNLNLLFWLSLIPFGTKWMGETHFDRFTVIAYSLLLIVCGISYNLLQNLIAKSLKNENSNLTIIIKKQNSKVLLSTVCNLLSIPTAFINPHISLVFFAISSTIWIVPSKEIEKELSQQE
ncbi:TMEM175 family protein [Chryseobacterium soli]|uniref:TMEM175 family protein n=1 Tax=Chryseobacterium soli TaxID=445961 RepID=UPI002955847C|nr:TMEM175 family protein [Chryseobacterium soli]MDV7696001.1 TMEM175 family protein [Chryseobacterium soli]